MKKFIGTGCIGSNATIVQKNYQNLFDIGKMIYAAYYGLDWLEVLKLFHFGNSELLELSETSGPGDTHVFNIEQHNL